MSAETFNERLPQNLPGKFYVTDQCLDCDLCRETAPTVFARDAAKGVSYVQHQPDSAEEWTLAQEALLGCPCEAIHADGDLHNWAAPREKQLPDWLRGLSEKPHCVHCQSSPVPKPWWKFW